MNIRPMAESDLDALLALWNRSAEFDRMTPELFEEKVFEDPDYDRDLSLLAEEEGRPCAMISGLSRQEAGGRVGFVKLLAVASQFRRRGLGSQLLQILEQKLAQSQVKTVRVFDSNPNYLMPGIDPRYTETLAFFEHHGYERFDETANMEADLTTSSFDTTEEERNLRAAGFEIRRAIMGDRKDIATFLSRHWSTWVPEVDRTLLNYPISLHLALQQDRIVAFSAYDSNNLNSGWFGPMGTDPDFRKHGLGRVLLLRCLADIKNQGHRLVIIPWIGPYRFYLRNCGARISRVFWRYRKRL